MRYYIAVEMDGRESLAALVKAMEKVQQEPNVSCVSLVDVDDGFETYSKRRITQLVSTLKSQISELKNEMYVSVEKAIWTLCRTVEHLRYWSLSSDKSFSCFYAGERLYLVQKKIGDLYVYMFISACSSKDATERAIKAWKEAQL